MTDRRPAHEGHDPHLIAAHVAGDLTGPDRAAAATLLSGCAACAALHDDLRAIARATRELPAHSRPRDFRLTPEVAERLRRGGWRRLLHALGGPSFAFVRPMGAALTTLGLAGLLLASLPGVQLGGSASAPAGGATASEMPAAAPATGDAAGAPRPQGGVDQEFLNNAGGSFDPSEQAPDQARGNDADPAGRDAAIAQRSADTTLMILSGSFVIVGLALFGLRWSARRLGDG
jgi:hypothetical protein